MGPLESPSCGELRDERDERSGAGRSRVARMTDRCPETPVRDATARSMARREASQDRRRTPRSSPGRPGPSLAPGRDGVWDDFETSHDISTEWLDHRIHAASPAVDTHEPNARHAAGGGRFGVPVGVLAGTTRATVPTSVEIDCQACHSQDGVATQAIGGGSANVFENVIAVLVSFETRTRDSGVPRQIRAKVWVFRRPRP